jgi:dihydroneopterin aldolase
LKPDAAKNLGAERKAPWRRRSALAHRQDKITLSGVKIFPRIGTTREERASAQECQADLVLWGDFEAAASTDLLEKSIDYVNVLSVIQQIASAQEYNLVETLAYKIVKEVFQTFPVSRVAVKVRKRPEMLREKIDFVEVEVEES